MEMKLFPLENIESLWMYKVKVVNNLNIKLETRIFGRLFLMNLRQYYQNK